MAEMATRSLMDRGVLAVLISFRDGDTANPKKGPDKSQPVGGSTAGGSTVVGSKANDKTARGVWRPRETPGSFQSDETLGGTLAKVWARDRRHRPHCPQRAQPETALVCPPA